MFKPVDKSEVPEHLHYLEYDSYGVLFKPGLRFYVWGRNENEIVDVRWFFNDRKKAANKYIVLIQIPSGSWVHRGPNVYIKILGTHQPNLTTHSSMEIESLMKS